VNVINCQLREATFVLDGLLHQETYRIQEHYVDTHGYTDLLWGLCEVLGVGFAPRLRDLPDQMIYRARRGTDYGELTPVLRRGVRDDLIVKQWDEINRVAASLKDGLVTPSLLVAKLQSLRRQNRLQQAIQELGRLPKTRHILSYVDDAALRRRVLVGLNKQERMHSMARAVCFGRQGRFPDRDLEAQLSRASALSLVLNAIVVFNTGYLAAAEARLDAEEHAVRCRSPGGRRLLEQPHARFYARSNIRRAAGLGRNGEEALGEVDAIYDHYWKAHALLRIVPHLPRSTLGDALTWAREVSHKAGRGRVLAL
jgi:TnpA family transposase